SNQRTDVNAHIEDGETTITAWISLGVQRAEHNLRGSFHATGTNGNQNKTDAQTRNSRNYCQSNVAQHDHYGRVEQGAFGAKQLIGSDRGQQARHVDQTTISTNN